MILILSLIIIFPLVKYVLKPLWEEKREESNKQEEVKIREISDAMLKQGIEEMEEEEFGEEDKQTVILETPSFDVSKVKEYQGEEIKKFEFRPETFEQFIGQAEAKNRALTIIKKAKRGIKTHLLVNGIKGHGKTTFVELLAKQLDAKLIEVVGKQVDEKNMVNFVNEINTSKEKYVIFFIDEFDSMDNKAIKVLNPIIESFKIGGKKIKPFIFAGATINKHELIKNNPDTLDRIPTHLKFDRYNAKEIATIIKQYQKQLYSGELFSQEVIDTISSNCKFNPRTSISLLEEFIVEQDIKKVLKNSNIVKDGLDKTDIAILEVLSQSRRATGANALAMRVGLSEKEYTREYEPFLVEYNYINRVPSRVITDKGRKFLEEING